MIKDITKEKILNGGDKVNKSAIARQFNCCWRTIDKRLNLEKYFKPKKVRKHLSILDDYKSIIDKKLDDNNIPATGILSLLKNKYRYKGGYGMCINDKECSLKKKVIDLFMIFSFFHSFHTILVYNI